MSQTGWGRSVALIAIFAWAAGLLAGVLLVRIYRRVGTQQDIQVALVTPMNTQPALPKSSPAAADATPDCPAHKYWSSCDPVPQSDEDLEKALMLPPESLGRLTVFASEGVGLKIDGASYRYYSPWANKLIVPGRHVIDMFDYRGMRHVRCEVDIPPGRHIVALLYKGCAIRDGTSETRTP